MNSLVIVRKGSYTAVTEKTPTHKFMNEPELPGGENNSDGPNFEDFDLLPEILQAISKMGYETPSPIQRRSIPPLLEGFDLLGVAQTGTGKTAAFALPLLSRLDPSLKAVQMLCLAPPGNSPFR